MRRRVKEVKVDLPAGIDLFEPKFPEYVDDVSAPIQQRVDAYEAWITAYWEPFIAARRQYSEANGVVFIDDIHMPDAPFDWRIV